MVYFDCAGCQRIAPAHDWDKDKRCPHCGHEYLQGTLKLPTAEEIQRESELGADLSEDTIFVYPQESLGGLTAYPQVRNCERCGEPETKLMRVWKARYCGSCLLAIQRERGRAVPQSEWQRP